MSPSFDTPMSMDRYARQIQFAPIGEEGQRKLLQSHVVLIGCGALGANLANLLVRSGVGHLRIVDRDFPELSNLQRQALFDEEDVRVGLPKAEAAARRLRAINSSVQIEPIVADVTRQNVAELADGAQLLLDGTDNFQTRFLINDLAVKTSRPWIYGAVVAATGLSLPILPGQTPCLRCVFEQFPPPEMSPTCATVGILAPVVTRVASHQAIEAIKILTGHLEAVDRRLLSFDAWSGRCLQINVQAAYDAGDCPCCKGGQYDYLDGRLES